jgi:peptidoglycan/xylan/chitin deacetylase (PgdA/CDA1 family)
MRIRRTWLVFSLSALFVVFVSVLLTRRRIDAATGPEPARFSGSRVIQRMPSLLHDPRLPQRVSVVVLRDEAAASFYGNSGLLDSITSRWSGAVAAAGADVRVLSGAAARADRAARVLVVPASPCLTVDAREAIDAIISRGGGVILTGLTGIDDAGCRPIGFGLIVGSTDASRADTLETRAMTYVTIPAGSPLTADIPPGSRIDLDPGRQVALRVRGRDAFYSDYFLQPQPAGGAPLLDAAMTRAQLGRGRLVYWGFELRDVVQLPWDQAVAGLLVRNAIAWAAGLPIASLEPWPNGHMAAASIAGDLEASFTNAQYAADSLSASHIRSTFFLTSDLAQRYGRLSRDLANTGEIGSHTENHRLLGGLPASVQRDRLETTQHDLARLLGLPVDGLRPPQEQFDLATLSAWLSVGGRYVFGANDGRSASPELLRIGRDTLVLIGRVGSDDFAAAAATHRDPAKMASLFGAEYERVRALGGVYALSYHSQLLATPRLVPALARMARTIAADSGVWTATLGQIADWWRARAQVETQVRMRGDGFDVTVRNRGERLVRGAVARVHLPSTRSLGDADARLLPAPPGDARLLIPPLPGKAVRTYAVDYAGVKRAAPARSAPRPRAAPRKRGLFWWLPWLSR